MFLLGFNLVNNVHFLLVCCMWALLILLASLLFSVIFLFGFRMVMSSANNSASLESVMNTVENEKSPRLNHQLPSVSSLSQNSKALAEANGDADDDNDNLNQPDVVALDLSLGIGGSCYDGVQGGLGEDFDLMKSGDNVPKEVGCGGEASKTVGESTGSAQGGLRKLAFTHVCSVLESSTVLRHWEGIKMHTRRKGQPQGGLRDRI